MKKLICLILLLCMILPVVACNGNKGPAAQTTAPIEGEQQDYLDTLPQLNFNGENFNILVTTQLNDFYDQKNESASIVDNACFVRNAAIEEHFDVELNYTNLDGNSSGSVAFSNAISMSLESDTDGFDIVIGQGYYCLPLVTVGAWHNLRESSNIHWEEDWYHHTINDNGTINGNLYGASGSFVISQLAYATPIFYNKDIYQRYGFAEDYDIYQLVRDKKWTWDVFFEMATAFDDMSFSSPANAVWGYNVYDHAAIGLITGLGVNIVEKDGNGEWTLDNFYNSDLEQVHEMVRGFLNDHKSSVRTKEITDAGVPYADFMSHVLFCQTYVHGMLENEALTPREGLTLGVVPSPLRNDKQDNYRTRVMRDELFYIPTNADLSASSIMIEALNYKTMQIVYPEYWEKVIELRSADTSEDSEMLQILAATVYFGFADYFSNDLLWVDNEIGLQAMNNAAAFNDWWKSSGRLVKNRLDSLVEIYG